MSRLAGALALALMVSGCGGGNYSAPRNLDDACSIVAQRPKYLAAMQRTQRKWGVPIAVQMATIHQESKFVGNARTPNQFALGIIPMGRQSSAYGYSQAIDGTWKEYKRSTGQSRAKRDNIRDATDFMGWYMDQSTKKLGIAKYDAQNQYLAYHEGHMGFARGSHFRKDWLMAVSARVATRARVYQDQLIACRKL
jgi:hypothetical protein